MICPTGAIEMDCDSYVIKDPFWHVEMDVEKTNLDKAEAEGRFRRLVPREDIDWDTPSYKVLNKHPRYVIPKE
jgi:hypothetical protein